MVTAGIILAVAAPMLVKRARLKIMMKFVFSIQSPSRFKAYIETLYFVFIHSTTFGFNKFLIDMTIGKHVQMCTNPYCVCFFSRISVQNFDSTVHQRRYLRIFDEISGDRVGLNAKIKMPLSIFEDKQQIQWLKVEHYERAGFIEAEEGSTKIKAHSTHDLTSNFAFGNGKDPSLASNSYVLELSNHHQFTAMICSFYSSSNFKTRSSISSGLFELICDMIAFHIYEYKNQTSALIYLHRYFHKRGLTILQKLRLVNFRQISSLSVDQVYSEDEIKEPLGTNLHLNQLLDYKRRVSELDPHLRNLTAAKIDFYSSFNDPIINFDSLVRTGEKCYNNIQKLKKEIDTLFHTSNRDGNLVFRAIYFDKALLEESRNSRKLAAKLISTKQYDTQYLRKMENSLTITKFKFNPFDVSNVVLLVSCSNSQSEFRFSNASDNAIDLFGLSGDAMVGQVINDFMPSQIAKEHDRFIKNFLNGRSNPRQSVFVNTFAKSISKITLTIRRGYGQHHVHGEAAVQTD